MTDSKDHIAAINEIIEDVSRSNAFSAEAMKQFVALREECESLERTNEYLRNQHKEAKKESAERGDKIKTLEGDKATLQVQLNGWIEREQELLKRESACLEWQLRCEYNETRVQDHKEMVGQIFRNTVVKKEVMTALPGLRADDSYGNRTEPYAHRDSVSETEE